MNSVKTSTGVSRPPPPRGAAERSPAPPGPLPPRDPPSPSQRPGRLRPGGPRRVWGGRRPLPLRGAGFSPGCQDGYRPSRCVKTACALLPPTERQLPTAAAPTGEERVPERAGASLCTRHPCERPGLPADLPVVTATCAPGTGEIRPRRALTHLAKNLNLNHPCFV